MPTPKDTLEDQEQFQITQQAVSAVKHSVQLVVPQVLYIVLLMPLPLTAEAEAEADATSKVVLTTWVIRQMVQQSVAQVAMGGGRVEHQSCPRRCSIWSEVWIAFEFSS